MASRPKIRPNPLRIKLSSNGQTRLLARLQHTERRYTGGCFPPFPRFTDQQTRVVLNGC